VTDRAGIEAKMRDLFAGLVGPSRRDEGSFQYELCADQVDPRRFVFIERRENEDARKSMTRKASIFATNPGAGFYETSSTRSTKTPAASPLSREAPRTRDRGTWLPASHF